MFKISTQFHPEAFRFKTAVLAGFDYAELMPSPTRLMSWKSLSKISRSFDLNYSLRFPESGKVGLETCEDIVSLARDIQCKIIVVELEHLPVAHEIRIIQPELTLAVRNRSIHFNDLDDWILTNHDVTLDIEDLWKNTLHDCEVEALSSVVATLFEKHRESIRHVYLPGYLPGTAAGRPLYCARDAAFRLFDIFLKSSYSGRVVITSDPSFQNEYELQMDHLLFRSWQSAQPQVPMVDARVPDPSLMMIHYQ